MTKNRNHTPRITPQRLAGLGCLVGLALAVAFAVVLYQQVRSLFRPPQMPNPGETTGTQDVAVTRGSIDDGFTVYGTIDPDRRAALGFDVARGRLLSLPVQPGQPVQAGDLLAELDSSVLERDAAKARADLLEAQKKLDKLGAVGGEARKLQLEIELRDARAALDKATADLQAFDAGQGTPQEKRARAAAELVGARAALATLQNSEERRQQIEQLQWYYNQVEVKHGEMTAIANPSEQDRDVEWLRRNDMLSTGEALEGSRLSYAMDIRAAEQRVVLAERALQALDREIAAGSPAVERARLAAAARQAEAAVQQAQARLDTAAGAPDVELAQAQADVLKLQGKAADAEAALAEARLVAPFSGMVEQVANLPDSLISNAQPVVAVVDDSSLHIVARVSDVDVARLKAGQEVKISLDAFRGQPPLAGHLGEIPLYGTSENGLTFFAVPVTFEGGQMPLRLGMTANVYVPLARRDNVLLVPAAALSSDGRDSFVWLIRGRGVERRKVVVGTSDGIMAEIIEGLKEGDKVRVPLQGPVGPNGWMMKGGY